MTPRALRSMTVAAVACVLADAGSAHAQTRAQEDATSDRCAAVQLDVSPSLAPAWQDSATKLRAELEKSRASCVTARLSLEASSNDEAQLIVTTSDGRRTERIVERPDLLVSTAIGVVVSLPPDSKEPTTESPPATTIVTRPPPPEPPQTSEPGDLHERADASSFDTSTHLWIGVSGGMRIAEPTFLGMVDIEGHATLEMHRWLILGSIRYGSSMGEAMVSTDDSYEELAGAVGLGRRFPIGPSQLDLVLMPSLVSATLGDDDETGEAGSARTELRLGALIGWSLPTEDGWRFTVSADSDVAPRGFDRPVRSDDDAPPLPVWTLALRLGAAGRLL